MLIVGCDECIDVLLQLLDRGERCARERLALEDGEPSLDLIEPRRPRRREMEVDLRMFLEPAVTPLMSVEIVEDDMQLAIRKGSHDVLHEAEELDTPAPLRMCRNDPSGG